MRPRSLLLPAVAILSAACGQVAGPVPPTGAATTAAVPQQAGDPIEVVYVLDGDSFEAAVAGETVEVRLLGINAPERGECWADRAREAAGALLGTGAVTLEHRGNDRFGRILGYVEAGGVPVNERLLEEGHALAVRGDHPRNDEFAVLEERAWEGRIGLWGVSACGPPAPAGPRIGTVDFDPPGPDDDPEDGERAEIVNRGDAPVDLAGWTLRDESSSHRFVFPSLVLGPGERAVVYSVCGRYRLCFGPGPVWSNGGDTALLLDPAGNVADRKRLSG